MQSPTTRLRRAERDLGDAEWHLDRVRGFKPGFWTSAEEVAEMRRSAERRVYQLRCRVAVRRDAVAAAAGEPQTHFAALVAAGAPARPDPTSKETRPDDR